MKPTPACYRKAILTTLFVCGIRIHSFFVTIFVCAFSVCFVSLFLLYCLQPYFFQCVFSYISNVKLRLKERVTLEGIPILSHSVIRRDKHLSALSTVIHRKRTFASANLADLKRKICSDRISFNGINELVVIFLQGFKNRQLSAYYPGRLTKDCRSSRPFFHCSWEQKSVCVIIFKPY